MRRGCYGARGLCSRSRPHAHARSHYCLAFDKLGPSLYSALKQARALNEASGRLDSTSTGRAGAGSYFSLSQIGCIAARCFTALAHMHRINLTHTDLKPENILFLVCAAARRRPIPHHSFAA